MTLEGFSEYVQKKLSNRWEIIRVSTMQESMITKETMRIVTNLRMINQEIYLKLIGSVFLYLEEFPHIANQLLKIVFLDRWEKRGWTFEAPDRYEEISKTPIKNLKTTILSYTRRGI